MSLLESTIQAIKPLNQQTMLAAQQRQRQLTKPAGSLGQLETISIQMAGISGQLRPLDKRRVVTMASDHGVAAAGVSAFPAAVTPQMVGNFLNPDWRRYGHW